MLIHHSESQKSRFDFGEANKRVAYAHHFAAHYCELYHDVLEVKSGFRLELLFFNYNKNVCSIYQSGDPSNDINHLFRVIL